MIDIKNITGCCTLGITVYDVITETAEDGVKAITAKQRIVMIAATNGVSPSMSYDDVITPVARELVVAATIVAGRRPCTVRASGASIGPRPPHSSRKRV